MRKKSFIFLIFSLVCLSSPAVFAQNVAPATVKTFEKDGLKFDYPADWKLSDKSRSGKQNLLLSKDDTVTVIEIDVHQKRLKSIEQFREIESDKSKDYFKTLTSSLNTTYEQRLDRQYLCLDLNGRKVTGAMLAGTYKNEPARAEFYSFVLGGRLVTLSYLSADKEAAKTEHVWKDLIKSLSLDGYNKEAAVSFFEPGVINEGYFNGRTSELMKPPYPAAARQMRVGGPVLVEIEINEKGELLFSKAISGEKIFWAVAESAVRRSTFKPVYGCGGPLRIKGIISYNFIP